MKVFIIRMKIFVLEDIPADQIRVEITKYLDNGLGDNPQYVELHRENRYKYYCYDNLYPIERDKVYKKSQIYTLTIRTLDATLAKYFSEHVVNSYTHSLKGLTSEIRILPQKHIDIIYTLTPAILKCDTGYWKDEMTLEQYEKRLKANLVKKWNQLHQEKMEEDFELFTGIEFLNKCPVTSEFKGIKLLGDKIRLHVADNEKAQALAYMALGAGILEMNARGFGFVNYRWL